MLPKDKSEEKNLDEEDDEDVEVVHAQPFDDNTLTIIEEEETGQDVTDNQRTSRGTRRKSTYRDASPAQGSYRDVSPAGQSTNRRSTNKDANPLHAVQPQTEKVSPEITDLNYSKS